MFKYLVAAYEPKPLTINPVMEAVIVGDHWDNLRGYDVVYGVPRVGLGGGIVGETATVYSNQSADWWTEAEVH